MSVSMSDTLPIVKRFDPRDPFDKTRVVLTSIRFGRLPQCPLHAIGRSRFNGGDFFRCERVGSGKPLYLGPTTWLKVIPELQEVE